MREEKKCNKCDYIKHYSFFRKKNNKSGWKDVNGGLRYSYCKTCESDSSYCKTCESDRMRDEYKRNPIPQMLSNSKIRAKNKNIPHNITTKDIKDVWPKDNRCPVLNINFEMGYKNKKKSHTHLH